MTIAQQLKITTFPFEIKDENGNVIYVEFINGGWYKFEYDQNGNEIYCEDNYGIIRDKRPKPEPVKKQTAVEWLYSELSKNHISNDSIKSRIDKEEEIWKQAKAMEKEQITIAYQSDRTPCSDEDAEQYYNEIYGGDK